LAKRQAGSGIREGRHNLMIAGVGSPTGSAWLPGTSTTMIERYWSVRKQKVPTTNRIPFDGQALSSKVVGTK